MEAMLVIIGTVVGFAIGCLARGWSIPWTTDEMDEMAIVRWGCSMHITEGHQPIISRSEQDEPDE
jgi:hypothetical protein